MSSVIILSFLQLTSRSELRTEIQFPASGVIDFGYAYPFPSLSMPPTTKSPGQDFLDNSNDYLDPEEERSWLYYLAEISLRRTMNRILEILYSRGEQHWINSIRQIMGESATCAEELNAWPVTHYSALGYSHS